MPILTVNYTYFVVSLSTAYIKFNDQLNPGISLNNMKVKMFASMDDYMLYSVNPAQFNSLIPVEVLSFRIYMSHLIYELKISTTSIESGVMEVALENRQLVNSSDGQKFYPENKILVTDIMYYRSESEFENYLGLLFGILLGLTGLLSLFIPALKYTIMSMKVFQMNNYFFLINVNLPANLYLFFRYIQYGNIINLLVSVNPMGFLTDGKCKEYERKLLVIGRDCQLFSNAGPHFLWFGVSFIIKMILELVQYNKEKNGEKRGKLYEFIKLKFGKRYFIELLSYFHMDLVLYNLLNLFFAELGSGTAFFNLLISTVFMVFFIYYYISLFVIIADNSKDFLLNNLCDPEGKLGLVRKDDADEGFGSMFQNKSVANMPNKQEKTVTEEVDEDSANSVQYEDLPSDARERLKTIFAEVVSNYQSPEAKRKITRKVEEMAEEEKRKGTFKVEDTVDDNRSAGGQVSTRNFGQISTRTGVTKMSKADKKKAEQEEKERQALQTWKQQLYVQLSIKEEFYIVARAMTESLKQKKKLHEIKLKDAIERGQEPPAKSDFMIKRKKGPTKTKDDATYSGANIYKFLFAASHCQNMYSKQYYAVGYVKEFLLALILVVSYSNAYIQTIVFTLIFIIYLYFNISKAPLQNKFNNKLLNVYTGLYVTMAFMTFVLVLFAGRVNAAILHFFFGYLLMIIEMAIIGVVITMAVSEFLKKRKDRLENEKHMQEMQARDAAALALQANKESGAVGKSSRRKKDGSKANVNSKGVSKANLAAGAAGVRKPPKKKSTISSRSGIYEDVTDKSVPGEGGFAKPPVKMKGEEGTEEIEGMEEDITVSNPAEDKEESAKPRSNSQAQSKPNVIKPAGKKQREPIKRQSNFSTGSFRVVDKAMPDKKIKAGGVFFTTHEEVDLEDSHNSAKPTKKFTPATQPNPMNSVLSQSGFSKGSSSHSGPSQVPAPATPNRMLRPKQNIPKEMEKQLKAKRVDSADDISAEISIDALNIEERSDMKQLLPTTSKIPTKSSLPKSNQGKK